MPDFEEDEFVNVRMTGSDRLRDYSYGPMRLGAAENLVAALALSNVSNEHSQIVIEKAD